MGEGAIGRLALHYGTRQRLAQAVHFSRAPAFVYVNNPKVACSTTKASLNRALAARAGEELVYRSMAEVHRRRGGWTRAAHELPPRAVERLLTGRRAFRFAFVRDPLARMISAYASKLNLGPHGPTEQRAQLCAYLGIDVETPLGIEEVAEIFVEDPDARDLNAHWMLQRRGIAFDLVAFDFVGRQERFAEDFAAATARIFGAPVPVFDTRRAFGRRTPETLRTALRTPRLEALVRRAFAGDYAMLDEIRARGLDRAPG